ncbi:hypothetical protein TH606_03065 [Thermodesulfatator autotrophicus]|uniref:Response regulatory domain-containing protein n=1 Tax=Thermodesulfatator autotrophicus TaxID=1795632 RepID=A0A177E860_9BACT|nr:hypothetical protein TH606_03065 [Thermodesulfatator autotrophicus]
MKVEATEDVIRILVAEDEKVFRILLFEELQGPNRIIKVASNGIEALEFLKREDFDLLITDLKMPGLEGIELLKEAKKINPRILVIVITGYASLDSAIQALKEGAYDYIRKPFSLEELKVSVNNACTLILLERENKRLLEDLRQVYQRFKESLEERTSSPNSLLDELERLARLHQEGFLDEEEFEAIKKVLIQRSNYE